jgi:hypothetical protein
MRAKLCGACAYACFLAATGARAEAGPSDWDGGFHERAERRSDFTIGASLGFGVGQASGYPNEIDKLDDPDFESDTGFTGGSSSALWLGVAFNDYLTFGIGFGGVGLEGNEREAAGGAFLFHVDVYPLYGRGDVLDDLALTGNFGAGTLTIKGGDEEADGGLMSLVDLGASWEHFRFWQMATGPTLSVTHTWSLSARLTAAQLGWRLSFYAGP